MGEALPLVVGEFAGVGVALGQQVVGRFHLGVQVGLRVHLGGQVFRRGQGLLPHGFFLPAVHQLEGKDHVLGFDLAGALPPPAVPVEHVRHPQNVRPVVAQGLDGGAQVGVDLPLFGGGGGVGGKAAAVRLPGEGEAVELGDAHPHLAVAVLLRGGEDLVDGDGLQGVVAGLLPGGELAVQGAVRAGVGRRQEGGGLALPGGAAAQLLYGALQGTAGLAGGCGQGAQGQGRQEQQGRQQGGKALFPVCAHREVSFL